MTFLYFLGMLKNPGEAKYYFKKQNQKYDEMLTIYEWVGKKSMTIVCNI